MKKVLQCAFLLCGLLGLSFYVGLLYGISNIDNKANEDYSIKQVSGTNNWVITYDFLEEYYALPIYYRVIYADELILIYISKNTELTELNRDKYHLAQTTYDKNKKRIRATVPYEVIQPRYTICINGESLNVTAESLFYKQSNKNSK